jgi:hypothetical protein
MWYSRFFAGRYLCDTCGARESTIPPVRAPDGERAPRQMGRFPNAEIPATYAVIDGPLGPTWGLRVTRDVEPGEVLAWYSGTDRRTVGDDAEMETEDGEDGPEYGPVIGDATLPPLAVRAGGFPRPHSRVFDYAMGYGVTRELSVGPHIGHLAVPGAMEADPRYRPSEHLLAGRTQWYLPTARLTVASLDGRARGVLRAILPMHARDPVFTVPIPTAGPRPDTHKLVAAARRSPFGQTGTPIVVVAGPGLGMAVGAGWEILNLGHDPEEYAPAGRPPIGRSSATAIGETDFAPRTSAAHRALASLAASGVVQAVVTTELDGPFRWLMGDRVVAAGTRPGESEAAVFARIR